MVEDWSDLQALWNSSRIGYTLATYPARSSWIESAMNDFVGDDFTSIGIESNDSGVKQSFALKGNDLGAFQQWMKNATYQSTWFTEGETPKQRGSLRSYTCTPVGGRDNEVFTLYEIGSGEYYLQWKSNWYYVFSENGVSFMD